MRRNYTSCARLTAGSTGLQTNPLSYLLHDAPAMAAIMFRHERQKPEIQPEIHNLALRFAYWKLSEFSGDL